MEATLQRKLAATICVALVLGLVQTFILWRTRPPQPPRVFPNTFAPVAP